MTRDNRSDVWLQPLVISALQGNGRTEGAICYAPLSQLEAEQAVLATRCPAVTRDESRDVQLICDRDQFPSDEYSGHWYSLKVTPKMLPIAPGHSLARYVPFSQLETERAVLADVKREGNLRIADLLRGMDSVAEYLEIVARELDSGHARVAAESLRRGMAL